jgi:transposase
LMRVFVEALEAPRLCPCCGGEDDLEPAVTLAKTLSDWTHEIVRMWRFTRNNGITEGFHRKMKLIQRRAYGIKSFDNYRLRVIAQCG